MPIIYLGSIFPASLLETIERNSKGNIQYASNAFQWHFLNGFHENNVFNLNIVNAPMVGSYPIFYKKLFLPEININIKNNIIGKSISYLNIPLIKNLFIEYGLSKELNYLVNSYKDEQITIVIYGMHTPFMKAALNAKKKNIKLCLIVPDLPEFMNNSKGIIWKLRYLIQPNRNKFIPFIDSFVLFTDAMADFLLIKNKPWIRIEGMVNPDEHKIKNFRGKSEKKVILYTGTLASRYGIIDLLDAFESINDPEYELWICGEGDTDHIINVKKEKDKRIKYFGLVPREKVLELQVKATVLVNPRSNKGEYTKYSFPSKTMEYLLSGTPVIMRKLPGIPPEYDKYIYYTSNTSIEAFRDKIIEVCEQDKHLLISFGKNARSFVLQEKNLTIQGKKIVDFIINRNFDKNV